MDNCAYNDSQSRVSLEYFYFLCELLNCRSKLAYGEIELFNLPAFRRVTHDIATGDVLRTEYIAAQDKSIYETREDNDEEMVLVSEKEFIDLLNFDIEVDRSSIERLQDEYRKKKKDAYPGLNPEPLEIIRVKYALDEPLVSEGIRELLYISDYDSLWSGYAEKIVELGRQKVRLRCLRDPKTRDAELKLIEKETLRSNASQLPDERLYEEAVKVALEFREVSTFRLQTELQIGYGRAAGIIDKMGIEGRVGIAEAARLLESINKISD